MRIAIVGGGCSGSLVAFQLLRAGFREPLTIVEPRTALGRGLAYSTRFDGHLLNVCAGRMSALPAEPSHFVDWLNAHHFPDASPEVFAPRRLYGDYLSTLLTEQRDRSSRFQHAQAEVTGIRAGRDSARLFLSDNSVLEADKVVLALGNPPSGAQSIPLPPGMEDRWHPSPWLGDALQLRAPNERILILGAGQTAVDTVLALQSQSRPCRVYLLSRTGKVPQTHPLQSETVEPLHICPEYTLSRIVRELRRRIRIAESQDIGWQAVIDALRPVSNQAWQYLSLDDRRRFLRHLKTLWETHRSRMAPAIARRLDILRADGRVEVVAGRVRETVAHAGAIEIRIALRAGGERRLHVDRVINCTGIHEQYHVRPRPLIANLLASGLGRANDLGIGFQADEHGALAGPASEVLYTLGPPRRGDLFETIAVPEIRVQAEALAGHLLGVNLASPRVAAGAAS